ncbi:hypothetical protein LCGC14_0145020 [marine sediment metagenome]|uniref:Uncharacterized protein n=1 Tax=marine sediment metagenome TaxID=412755 RepID=A0A0F9UZP3_9ZZZZ
MPPKDKSTPADLDGPQPARRRGPTRPLGVGSAYVANQPGNVGKPTALNTITETIEEEGLPVVGILQEEQVEPPPVEEEPETEIPEEEPVQVEDETSSLSDIDIDKLPLDKEFDFFDEYRNSKKVRAEIEKDLPKINIGDLIVAGYVEQTVRVMEGFTATFRSVDGVSILGIEQDSYTIDGSGQYIIRVMQYRRLAIGISSINGDNLPPHLDHNSEFDTESFKKKFKRIVKLPGNLIDMLWANMLWFEERVADAVTPDSLKN